MSCCGSKRHSYNEYARESHPAEHKSTIPGVVYHNFRYTGQSGMIVTGGITGTQYRFPYPGAEVLVDKRDSPGMAAVPNIERI